MDDDAETRKSRASAFTGDEKKSLKCMAVLNKFATGLQKIAAKDLIKSAYCKFDNQIHRKPIEL